MDNLTDKDDFLNALFRLIERFQEYLYLAEHEGLIDDATAALEPYASHTLVEQVVDAALQSRSRFEWVIQACRKQAEPIIEGGKAEYYSSAAKWLAKARTAYQGLGREAEWH